MSQAPLHPQAPVQPGPNIYTMLLLIAIGALIATLAILLNNLMSQDGYALTFSQIFGGLGLPSK